MPLSALADLALDKKYVVIGRRASRESNSVGKYPRNGVGDYSSVDAYLAEPDTQDV